MNTQNDCVKVKFYLFGLICISSYTLGLCDLKWLKISRDLGGYYCYFQFTLPIAIITGVTLHTITIQILKPKHKWQS